MMGNFGILQMPPFLPIPLMIFTALVFISVILPMGLMAGLIWVLTGANRRKQHFKAIAAMAENRVIGRGGEIPWHLPEDFKWFKQMTTGNVVVMGRRTFEAIGKPLPNREIVVLSQSGFAHEGARTVRSLNELNPAGEKRAVFIAGGAQVYEEALPRCSDLLLTIVKREVEGDVLLPPFEDLFEEVAVLREEAEFRIVHYRNRALG